MLKYLFLLNKMAIAIKAWKPCCMLANTVAVNEGFDTVQFENV